MNVIKETDRVRSEHLKLDEKAGLTSPSSHDPKRRTQGAIDRNDQGPESPTMPSVNNSGDVAARHASVEKKQVTNSLTTQRGLVLESVFPVDVLVGGFELKDNEIYPQVALMRVLDELDKIINNQMKEAKVEHIDKTTGILYDFVNTGDREFKSLELLAMDALGVDIDDGGDDETYYFNHGFPVALSEIIIDLHTQQKVDLFEHDSNDVSINVTCNH